MILLSIVVTNYMTASPQALGPTPRLTYDGREVTHWLCCDCHTAYPKRVDVILKIPLFRSIIVDLVVCHKYYRQWLMTSSSHRIKKDNVDVVVWQWVPTAAIFDRACRGWSRLKVDSSTGVRDDKEPSTEPKISRISLALREYRGCSPSISLACGSTWSSLNRRAITTDDWPSVWPWNSVLHNKCCPYLDSGSEENDETKDQDGNISWPLGLYSYIRSTPSSSPVTIDIVSSKKKSALVTPTRRISLASTESLNGSSCATCLEHRSRLKSYVTNQTLYTASPIKSKFFRAPKELGSNINSNIEECNADKTLIQIKGSNKYLARACINMRRTDDQETTNILTHWRKKVSIQATNGCNRAFGIVPGTQL